MSRSCPSNLPALGPSGRMQRDSHGVQRRRAGEGRRHASTTGSQGGVAAGVSRISVFSATDARCFVNLETFEPQAAEQPGPSRPTAGQAPQPPGAAPARAGAPTGGMSARPANHAPGVPEYLRKLQELTSDTSTPSLMGRPRWLQSRRRRPCFGHPRALAHPPSRHGRGSSRLNMGQLRLLEQRLCHLLVSLQQVRLKRPLLHLA